MRLVVGLRDSWLVHEQIDDEVDVVAARTSGRERPEDADRADFADQCVEQSEGHGGLAGKSFR